MKIFIVIPAYNEAKRVGPVLHELKSKKYTVVLVDDASSDNTSAVGERGGVVVLRHIINLGKGAAMKTGASYAFEKGAEAVVFMDSDGQHAVSDLPGFINALNSGYDVVLGVRSLENAPAGRLLGHKIATSTVKMLFGVAISDLLCGFRGLTRKAFDMIDWESRRYGVETEMVAKMIKHGLKYTQVPVKTIYFAKVGFDRYKGLSFVQAANIFIDVLRWKFTNKE